MSTLPKVVEEMLDREWEISLYPTTLDVKEINGDDFCAGPLVVIPGHGWDLCESNITENHTNLRRVRLVEALSGPSATFYEKSDPDKPAFVVFSLKEGSWGTDKLLVEWFQV